MREGLIPAILGTAVTAAGTAMRVRDMRKHGMTKRDTRVAIGRSHWFRPCPYCLGSIDLLQNGRS